MKLLHALNTVVGTELLVRPTPWEGTGEALECYRGSDGQLGLRRTLYSAERRWIPTQAELDGEWSVTDQDSVLTEIAHRINKRIDA
jgi:hypothetical protein